jgi:hypothetical protein
MEAAREYEAAIIEHQLCFRILDITCSSYFDHILLGPCKHNFFGNNFQAGLFITFFVIVQPTVEDKFTVLSDGRFYPEWHPLYGSASSGHVVHHIMSFEDLQSPGDEVTGYSLNYDFITDHILIQRTKGIQRKPWAANLPQTKGMLFCGSPAAFIYKLKDPKRIVPHVRFDLVCKLIACDWIMLMSDTLMHIESPAWHRETFSPHLLDELAKWMITANEGLALDEIPSTTSGVFRAIDERSNW